MNFVSVEADTRIAVNDCNPKGGCTVVFVHGWPLAKEIFEYQLDILPRYGIRCVTVDLRGFGDSDKPWSGYSYNKMADDLHKVLCSMNLRCVTLFGFSMGGAVCARYLARHGCARVSKLVLCGAACPCFTQRPDYPYGKTMEEVNTIIGSCYRNRPKAVSDFGKTAFALNHGEEFMDWVSSFCLKAAGYSTIKSMESLRDEDLRQDLPQITVPTAIFHGVHDQVCSFVFASLMNKAIRNSKIVTFENSGHALMCDEKEKCNTCLLEFLEVGNSKLL